MQKFLSILVGISMVVVALIIVGQQQMLKGYITDGRRVSDNVEDVRSSSTGIDCTTDSLSQFACMSCCTAAWQNGEFVFASREYVFNACVISCTSAFGSSTSSEYTPYSSWGANFSDPRECAQANNCARGPSTCDPGTCLQRFNLGYCTGNSQLCAFVDVRCADQSQCSQSKVVPQSSLPSSSRNSSSSKKSVPRS